MQSVVLLPSTLGRGQGLAQISIYVSRSSALILLRHKDSGGCYCALSPPWERAAPSTQHTRLGEGASFPLTPSVLLNRRAALSRHKGVYARLRGFGGEGAATATSCLVTQWY